MNQRYNCIYLCVISEPWIEVAKELESTLSLEPTYILHWRSESEKFKSAFPDASKHLVEDAWKGLCFSKEQKSAVLDESLLNAISQYELIGIKMMDRLDPTLQNFSFCERQRFFRDLVRKWLGVIEDNKIEFVISPSIPHRVFDYALYVASKLSSVNFYMFQMVPFGSRTVLIDDINSMTPHSLEESCDSNLKKEIKCRIKKVKGDYSSAIPDYMLNQKKSNSLGFNKTFYKFLIKIPKILKVFSVSPNTYWVQFRKNPAESKFNWLSYYSIKAKQKRRLKELKSWYESSSVKADHKKKYILIALHYQPEETSCPTGGVFVDQELMVQMLDSLLPDDYMIYVKEHKSQFYPSLEGAVSRDINFYKRLFCISSRVKLISVDENPFDLIDSAYFVCTISGTIGWESALRGTPALHFGRAWYEGMPLTYKVKSLSDLTRALGELKSEEATENDFLDFHFRLANSFIHAKHYKANRDNTDVDYEISKTNLVKAISEKVVSRP